MSPRSMFQLIPVTSAPSLGWAVRRILRSVMTEVTYEIVSIRKGTERPAAKSAPPSAGPSSVVDSFRQAAVAAR